MKQKLQVIYESPTTGATHVITIEDDSEANTVDTLTVRVNNNLSKNIYLNAMSAAFLNSVTDMLDSFQGDDLDMLGLLGHDRPHQPRR